MSAADRHSRLVGWLKVGLPLAALALLSTLFLVADRIDPDAALPYANVDVEALVRDPRMTAPAYAGTTEDGTAITLSADMARPANGTRTATADGVRARMIMPGGGTTEITAATADLDHGAGELRMTGGVRIVSSSGYDVTAPAVVTALNRSLTTAEGPVSARGPAGQIDANGFSMRQPGAEDAAGGGQSGSGLTASGEDGRKPYLLVFSGGVKLVYQPGR